MALDLTTRIQHSNTQYNDDTQHDATQYYNTHHNDMTIIIMILSIIVKMFSKFFLYNPSGAPL
jgi:hypothetical protein